MYGEYRFFSFNKQLDWDSGIFDNLIVTDKGLSINQTEKYGIDQIISMSNLVGPTTVNDFALGREGRMYLIDESCSLWVYDYTNEHIELLLRNSEFFSNQSLLAAYNELLFLADPAGKVIAYSLSNGQIMWTQTIWEDKDLNLYPLSITIDKNGYIYLLLPLHVEMDEKKQIFLSADGELAVVKLTLAGTIVTDFKINAFKSKQKRNIIYLKDELFMTISQNGVLYIMDRDTNTIIQYENQVKEMVQTRLQVNHQFLGFSVDSYENLYVGDYQNDTIIGEDDRFIQIFNRDGEYQTRISNYRGAVTKIVIDSKDRIFIWNSVQETFSLLSLKQRTMERTSTKLLEGVFLSVALDTKIELTRWHKLLATTMIPKETQIQFSYFAADQKMITINDEVLDLDDYIKNDSIPIEQKEEFLKSFWSNPITNARDALLFDAVGRYLWIKIKLIGSERQTPMIERLRVYFPRMSYLSFLPAIYQEDPLGNHFLERFLALFEKFLSEMDEHIDQVPNYFTTNEASGEFLRWLSTWLGIAVDDSWTDDQIKKLIREAPTLYKKRGTKAALEKIIEVYTGEKPIIVEHFQLKSYKNDSAIKEIITRLFGDHPYCFYVLIKPYTITSEKVRIMVQKIIEDEKPAYTEARLIVLEPWIYLDMQTYLGINTYLSEQSLMTLNNKSYMPSDTVLIDVNRDHRLDIHSRMEFDSQVE